MTSAAAGITNQNGNVYQVDAYESDWFPGTTAPAVARVREIITNDDWSATRVLHAIDASGQPTSEEKVLPSRTYSIVFFVSPPGSPPSAFTELRVTVNGDVLATAPAWGSW